MRAPPFQVKKKKKRGTTKQDRYRAKKKKLGGEQEGQNHQQHTRTAHSVHTGEQAPRWQGHRTSTCTEGSKGTGHHGLQPQGRTHWGDLAGPPGQWQERYSKTAGPSPARLHRGPLQTSPGAIEATDDRRAGTKPERGSPTKQRGPATRAPGVRRSYRRLAGAIPPVARDTPYGWAAPRAAAHREGACDPTHRHMWGHQPNGNTWTGWPRHCLPKHLRERLKRHLTYGSGGNRTSPW